MPKNTRPVLAVRQLARRLGVSDATALRVARVIGFRVGRRLFVTAEALDRWTAVGGSRVLPPLSRKPQEAPPCS
jgi:hypothetical protein